MAISRDPLVEAVEQPWHRRQPPREQRNTGVPGNGEEQPDRSRAADTDIATHGPCCPIRLRHGQTRPFTDAMSLGRHDLDLAVSIDAVEPTG